jgi:hypothetical protein
MLRWQIMYFQIIKYVHNLLYYGAVEGFVCVFDYMRTRSWNLRPMCENIQCVSENLHQLYFYLFSTKWCNSEQKTGFRLMKIEVYLMFTGNNRWKFISISLYFLYTILYLHLLTSFLMYAFPVPSVHGFTVIRFPASFLTLLCVKKIQLNIVQNIPSYDVRLYFLWLIVK